MHWLKDHWKEIFVALGVLSAVCTVINARLPKDENGYVKRPPSWPSFFWRVLIDLLAWVPQPGKAGLFGPLPLNVPGIPSFNTPPKADEIRRTEPPKSAGIIGFGVMIVLALGGIALACFLSGCANPIAATRLTISTTASFHADAFEQFKSWDKTHQIEIVAQSSTKEERDAKTTEYRAARDKVRKAFVDLYAGLRAAETATNMAAQGVKNPKDLTAIAMALMQNARDLLEALRLIGVPLGGLI